MIKRKQKPRRIWQGARMIEYHEFPYLGWHDAIWTGNVCEFTTIINWGKHGVAQPVCIRFKTRMEIEGSYNVMIDVDGAGGIYFIMTEPVLQIIMTK